MLLIMENYVNEKHYDQIPLIILFEGYDQETKTAKCIHEFDTTEAFVEKIQLYSQNVVCFNGYGEKNRQYYWKSLHIPGPEHYAYFRQKERNADPLDENPADKVYADWRQQQPFQVPMPPAIEIRHPTQGEMKGYRKQWRDLRKLSEEQQSFPELAMVKDPESTKEQKEAACARHKAFYDNQEKSKKKMFEISHKFMIYDTEHMKKQVSNWVKRYNGKEWVNKEWIQPVFYDDR